MNNVCWMKNCNGKGFVVHDGKIHCFSCWSDKVANDFNHDQKFLLFNIVSKVLEASKKEMKIK